MSDPYGGSGGSDRRDQDQRGGRQGGPNQPRGNQRGGPNQPTQPPGQGQPNQQRGNQPNQPDGNQRRGPGPGGPGGPNQPPGRPPGPRKSLDIAAVIRDGLNRFISYTGGILVAAVIIQQLLMTAAVNTIAVELFETYFEDFEEESTTTTSTEFQPTQFTEQFGLTFPDGVPLEVAAVVLVATLVVGIVIQIGALRALIRPQHELDHIPSEVFTKNMLKAFFSYIIGGIIAVLIIFVATLLGVIALIIGAFVAFFFFITCFYLFPAAVAVENKGPIASLRRSWELTKGQRLQVFAVIIILAAIGWAVGLVASPAAFVSQTVADIISGVLSGVTAVLGYAVLVEVFLQLRGDK